MAAFSAHTARAERASSNGHGPPTQLDQDTDRRLIRWGGIAGLAGPLLLIGSVVVVTVLGLPDASDVETLRDFADIESGRIAEHFLYLGALVMFALHVFVLQRMLTRANQTAALFGTVIAAFGLVIMAASSVLHLSTAPLFDLYNEPGTSPEDLRAIEYAWHGAQSVFDTMLITGVLLVPIGIVLFGVAMRSSSAFGSGVTWLTIGLGAVGIIGAVIAVIDPGSMFAAAGVLAIALFHLSAGWRTFRLGGEEHIDLTGRRAA
jgi:hypothetical protein